MNTDVVTIRIDRDTSNTIRKMIEHGLAISKADAVRQIMLNGLVNTRRTVERKEGSALIIKKWRKNGLPKLPNNLSNLSIKERG